jgi:hypothetical protein
MGILSTHPTKIEGKKIIVSEDKDMRSIPGWLYNPSKDVNPQYISEHEADRYHLYQTLTGDSTDGYKGCPNIGPVKATKILDTYHPNNWWDEIVDAYRCQGLSEANALTQSRIARICRATDYDFTSNNVLLWHPSKIKCTDKGLVAKDKAIERLVERALAKPLKTNSKNGSKEAEAHLNELEYSSISNDIFLKAETLYKNKKYIQAIQLFNQLADLGHTESQLYLGLMHFNAEGADEDHDEAVYWFHEAAQQNFAPAQYKLGEMYLYGTGIELNNEEAFYWLNKAAEQSHKDAQKILKKLFLNGKRVVKNKKDTLPAFKSDNLSPIGSYEDSLQQKINGYEIGGALPDGSIIFYIDHIEKRGLAVQKDDIPRKVTWEQAKQAANEYGLDWHLPNMNELALLFVQSTIIGSFSPCYYWSSLESSIKGAWLYSFDEGNQISSFKAYANRARAVRNFLFDENLKPKATQHQLTNCKLGDILPDDSIIFYVDDSRRHGVSAKKNDERKKEVTWTEANDLVKAHGLGWRLPTADELNFLFEEQNIVGGFDSYFDGRSCSHYWSSLEKMYLNSDDRALCQDFDFGSRGFMNKKGECLVRAVKAF